MSVGIKVGPDGSFCCRFFIFFFDLQTIVLVFRPTYSFKVESESFGHVDDTLELYPCPPEHNIGSAINVNNLSLFYHLLG